MAKSKVSEVLKSDDSTKEKLEYLWSYYRVHLLVIILGIVLGGYMIYDWVNRTVTHYHVSVLSSAVLSTEEEPLAQEIQELLQPEEENEAVYASFTAQGQMLERFVAQLSANEYDIILFDEESFENYSEPGNMQEFRIAELDEESAYYQPDGYNNPMGIDASHLDVFDNYATTENLILVIPGNSQRKDKTIELFATQGYTLEYINE